MASQFQYSTAIRNAQADQVEAVPGPSPILRVYDGTMPANCAAPLSGNTLLAEGTLLADWLSPASNGVKSKYGSWEMTGQAGAGSGKLGTFFRLYDSTGATCHIQGTFGYMCEMVPDNPNIAVGQTVNIHALEITRGCA